MDEVDPKKYVNHPKFVVLNKSFKVPFCKNTMIGETYKKQYVNSDYFLSNLA
jgi:hypothetical protein